MQGDKYRDIYMLIIAILTFHGIRLLKVDASIISDEFVKESNLLNGWLNSNPVDSWLTCSDAKEIWLDGFHALCCFAYSFMQG